jgi:Zn-dependent protease with chaperone function/uncharacterized tellurite resistance protein B-like protein
MTIDFSTRVVEPLKALRNNLCGLITRDTAPKLHAPHLLPLAKDGVGHFIVEMALYSDLLRLAADAANASGGTPKAGEERADAFAWELFKQLARYRREYPHIIDQEGRRLSDAFGVFRADRKAFGYACEQTRMAGLELCRRADALQTLHACTSHYRQIMAAYAETLMPGANASAQRASILAAVETLSPAKDGTPLSASRLPELRQVRIACEADLYEELMALPVVQEMVGTFDSVRKLSEARCDMLRDGVRVSSRILPRVAATVDRLRTIIGDETPCEAYVFSRPDIQAFVTLQDDVALIGLSSGAVQQLSGPGELEFVLGHELGHVLFKHGLLPDHALLKSGRLSVRQAMRVRAWERAAEISADRVGLLVCGSLQSAAASFFKLIAGVSLQDHSFDLNEFSGQWDELSSEITALGQRELWDCSHPLAPLRMRAMVMFWEAWNDRTIADRQATLRSNDESVRRMLTMMDPSEVCDQTTGSDTLLAPFFFWGGLYVAMADGELSAEETNRLLELAPPGFQVGDPFTIAKTKPNASLDQFKGDLDSRRRKFTAIELYRIMAGVLSVACADGTISPQEQQRIHEIGAVIGLRDVACDLVVQRYLSEAKVEA